MFFTALLLNQEVAGLVTQRMESKERGEEREVGRAADSCLNFKEKLMIHLEGVYCNDTDRTTSKSITGRRGCDERETTALFTSSPRGQSITICLGRTD